jgi:hypothetical protein
MQMLGTIVRRASTPGSRVGPGARRLLLAALAVAVLSSCTWAQRLAWDSEHGWPAGTTNHLLVEAHGPQANAHPDAVVTLASSAPIESRLTDPVDQAIQQAFGRYGGAVVTTARRIVACESGFNPRAVSSTGDYGTFQINKATWNKPGHSDPVADFIGRNWGQVFDPFVNAEMARRIYAAYGWRMWACY